MSRLVHVLSINRVEPDHQLKVVLLRAKLKVPFFALHWYLTAIFTEEMTQFFGIEVLV